MKLRISLTEQNGEIKGQIETPPHPEFVLEALALVVEIIAQKWEVPVNKLLEDVWATHVKSTYDQTTRNL